MKKLQVLTGVLVLTIFFVMSCERKAMETPTSVATKPTADPIHGQSGPAIKRSTIHPDQFIETCDDDHYAIYQTIWEEQYQFRPVTGKRIGTWDDNPANQRYYFNTLGFTLAMVSQANIVDSLIAIGYSPGNIYVGLPDAGWQSLIEAVKYKEIKRYYIDEPIQYSRQQLVRDAAAYLGSGGSITLTISEMESDGCLWYGSPFYSGRIGGIIDLYESTMPTISLACHSHFESNPCHDIDPRDQWTYLRNQVPSSAFQVAWIKTNQEDANHMGLLFGHANNIGINEILLYPGSLDLATHVAWQNGWLQKFEKQVRQQWCCPTPNFDPGWCTLTYSTYTGLTRWQ